MRYLLVFILCCLAAVGCDKNKMPKPSTSGQDILACKVDGKTQIYQGKGSYVYQEVSFIPYVSGSNSDIWIAASSGTNHDHISFQVLTANVELNKRYSLGEETSGIWADYYGPAGQTDPYKTKSGSGFILFTRYDSRIASGKFQYTAYRANGEKVEITEGFFDITAP